MGIATEMKEELRYFVVAVLATATAIAIQSVYAGPLGTAAVCHATNSPDFPYYYLESSAPELSAHLNSQGSKSPDHEQDFVPADSDCNTANDQAVKVQDQRASGPEPVTMLLFGTGLAGLGYASRRYFGSDSAELGGVD